MKKVSYTCDFCNEDVSRFNEIRTKIKLLKLGYQQTCLTQKHCEHICIPYMIKALRNCDLENKNFKL